MPPYSRREALLTAGAAVLASAALTTTPNTAIAATPATTGFLHGVASGDPYSTSVLLWTRITPTATATPGSGKGATVAVTWEVASNAAFTTIAARGSFTTGAARDHTVKVIPTGLKPATTYWYRFSGAGTVSAVGRTKTLPAATSALARLRMGVVSCANWQAGYFSAYRHLAARTDLDVILHLGDYLYEYGPGQYQARGVLVRPHDPAVEMTTLNHYRRRHAQYKTDPDLKSLHAKVPFIATWDDHEFANDAWSGGAQNHTDGTEGTWAARRGYSQKAYAEWMPVRYEIGGKIYRDFNFGTLAKVNMLDLRSYRSKQVSSSTSTAEIASTSRTITGPTQMDWLLAKLSSTTTHWKIIGSSVMFSPVRYPAGLAPTQKAALNTLLGETAAVDGITYNVDQWDGYTADRNKVIAHLATKKIKNTVFLVGDVHSGWAVDVPADVATYPTTNTSVATELVCTSVTSDNLDDLQNTTPRTASLQTEAAIKAANKHVKYLDFDSHGFSVVEITPTALKMDWYVLANRTSPTSTAKRSTSWQITAGTQHVTASTGIV